MDLSLSDKVCPAFRGHTRPFGPLSMENRHRDGPSGRRERGRHGPSLIAEGISDTEHFPNRKDRFLKLVFKNDPAVELKGPGDTIGTIWSSL